MKYNFRATIKDSFGHTQALTIYSDISIWKAFYIFFVDIYFKTKKSRRNHIIIELDEKLTGSKNEQR